MTHHFISDTFAAARIGYTYDTCGNVLTRKDGGGSGYEYTRDTHGRELTYKDHTGFWTALAHDHATAYVLYYNADTGIYWAGCRRLTRTKALAHWSAPKRTDARAVLFHAAITNHIHSTSPTPSTT